jgi:hypothetical protein
MAKKQTRRSISLAGTTYARLRVHADENGTTMSDVVEKLLAPLLASTPPRARPRASRALPAERAGGVKLW